MLNIHAIKKKKLHFCTFNLKCHSHKSVCSSFLWAWWCWPAVFHFFQAVSPLSLPGFSSAASQASAPTRSPTTPIISGCPSVGILRLYCACCQCVCMGIHWVKCFLIRTVICVLGSHFLGVLQLHQEHWPASWERGSTDPGSSCQQAWWLEQGITKLSYFKASQSLSKVKNRHSYLDAHAVHEVWYYCSVPVSWWWESSAWHCSRNPRSHNGVKTVKWAPIFCFRSFLSTFVIHCWTLINDFVKKKKNLYI